MPTASPAGYSGTALFKKLGIKANNELCVINVVGTPLMIRKTMRPASVVTGNRIL